MNPLQALVMDLSGFMLTIDPRLETKPAVGKTISRIYRDTRFSRDKSLYKSNMWVTFKRPGEGWKDTPVYFFEIFPDWYRYGMGFYSASKQTMDKLREMIDTKPEEFQKAISFNLRHPVFVVEGEQYKKILDKDKPEEIRNWYQRKNLYLTCNKKVDDRLFSPALIDDLVFGFGLIAPLYHYLWKVKQKSLREGSKGIKEVDA